MFNELMLELRAQGGPDIAKYGLVVALIALIGVVGMMLLGTNAFTLHSGDAVVLLDGVGP